LLYKRKNNGFEDVLRVQIQITNPGNGTAKPTTEKDIVLQSPSGSQPETETE
jgi:hypothetical protein